MNTDATRERPGGIYFWVTAPTIWRLPFKQGEYIGLWLDYFDGTPALLRHDTMGRAMPGPVAVSLEDVVPALRAMLGPGGSIRPIDAIAAQQFAEVAARVTDYPRPQLVNAQRRRDTTSKSPGATRTARASSSSTSKSTRRVLPDSNSEMARCDTPAASASSTCVSPASSRASRSRRESGVIRQTYTAPAVHANTRATARRAAASLTASTPHASPSR